MQYYHDSKQYYHYHDSQYYCTIAQPYIYKRLIQHLSKHVRMQNASLIIRPY